MIKKQYFLLIIVFIILITALILRLNEEKEEDIKEDIIVNQVEENNIILENASFVEIIQPQENEVISSPYKVKGIMSTNLLKENNYYIVLLDEKELVLNIFKIETDDDWLSMEKIPIWANLEFTATSSQGYISIRQEQGGKLLRDNEVEKIKIKFK
jgi:hypothetical protein